MSHTLGAKAHNWSGAPGMVCMTCHNESPLEYAITCPACDLKCYPNDPATDTMCALHTAWAEVLATGCPPDRDAVRRLLTTYPELRP